MSDITEFLKKGRRVFVSGACGVSTSALCDLMQMRGVAVSGSDRSDGSVADYLRSKGVTLHIGHSAENLGDAECVVRSAAIHDTNPEIVEAHRRGIPVFERADAWGAIMTEHDHAVCIAGTHGKTTTTALAAQIAMGAGLDPTLTIGGAVSGIGTHRVGSSKLIIAEACEYCNSFLRFRPTTAVVLNIEEDHLDFFSGIDDIKRSFERFVRLIPASGRACINLDNPNSAELFQKLAADPDFAPRQLIPFGTHPDAAVRAENITDIKGRCSFDLVFDPSKTAAPLPAAAQRVSLRLCGRYNVTNALGAAAALWGVVDAAAIADSLSGAVGAARRFEYRRTLDGCDVYDDYAHHPSELKATFTAAREALDGKGRLVVVFQPHTYSRTKALLNDFANALKMPDAVCLLPIYAAREDPDPTVSSELLASLCGADAVPDFDAAAAWARAHIADGDMLMTVGAGEANKIIDLI